MANILLGSIFSFLVTFFVLPMVLRVARQKKLYDIPDERKIHITPIPSLGGVGIFVGFSLSFLIFANISSVSNVFQYYIAAFVLIFFIGLKDDIVIISPTKKFLGQLIAAAILTFKGGVLISSLHGFLGLYTIPPVLSYLFTLLTIIVTTNAYNLIDGVDGLAGIVGIVTSSVLAIFLYVSGNIFYSTIGFFFSCSLAAFLFYNFSRRNKIFMGDTGSMLTGLVNVILVIRFIETADTRIPSLVSASPAMGFGILMLPLLDTLRVFALRILKGRSPFSPDRNHLHHMLLDIGLSHKQIAFGMGLTALSLVVISFVAQPLGSTILIPLQVLFFFSGVYLLSRITKTRDKKRHIILDEDDAWKKKIRNVVTIIGYPKKTTRSSSQIPATVEE